MPLVPFHLWLLIFSVYTTEWFQVWSAIGKIEAQNKANDNTILLGFYFKDKMNDKKRLNSDEENCQT